MKQAKQQSQSQMTIRDVKVKAGFAALRRMLPRFTLVSLGLSGIAAAIIHLVFQLNVFTAFVVIFLTVLMLLGIVSFKIVWKREFLRICKELWDFGDQMIIESARPGFQDIVSGHSLPDYASLDLPAEDPDICEGTDRLT